MSWCPSHCLILYPMLSCPVLTTSCPGAICYLAEPRAKERLSKQSYLALICVFCVLLMVLSDYGSASEGDCTDEGGYRGQVPDQGHIATKHNIVCQTSWLQGLVFTYFLLWASWALTSEVNSLCISIHIGSLWETVKSPTMHVHNSQLRRNYKNKMEKNLNILF